MKCFGFSKGERLRKHSEFVNVTRNGQKIHTTHFIVFLTESPEGKTRLGVTVSRRVGKAVKRNRVKRLLREFFRLHKHLLPQGYDVVIIAKPQAGNLDYHQVKKELSQVLCKSR